MVDRFEIISKNTLIVNRTKQEKGSEGNKKGLKCSFILKDCVCTATFGKMFVRTSKTSFLTLYKKNLIYVGQRLETHLLHFNNNFNNNSRKSAKIFVNI